MLKNPLYIHGPKDVQIPANLHFGEFVLDQMLKYSNRIAFVNGSTGEFVTYKQLTQEAMNLAVSLTQIGVRKGETVAICSENRAEFLSTALGIICSGAVLTTVNLGYSKDELKHVLGISKPKYIFCSPFGYKAHHKALNTLPYLKKIIVFGDEAPPSTLLYKDLVAKDVNPEDFVVAEVKGQTDTMMVLYSSGTTGLPKGVMLTHHNALLGCNMSGKDPSLSITVLVIAPWYHTMGLMGALNSAVCGRKIVYLTRFDEKLYLKTIEKYKVNMITIVPPIAVLLSKSLILNNYDVSSVNIIYCGAAPLDTDTVNEILKRFPAAVAVLQGYGMTECTLAITRDTDLKPKPGSVGQVTPGAILKVVDIETRKVLGPNEAGEICVKGPVVMKGYIGKELKDDFDEEGFYKTGDIGYYDEEKYFFIVDRLKELIKYKAYQVPPAEIEALLLQHPGVRDAGVVGAPDKVAGEVPVAFIVKQSGVEVTEKELIEFVASKLSNPKHLRGGVHFIEQIPKNPSGKILRRYLRNQLKLKKSKL